MATNRSAYTLIDALLSLLISSLILLSFTAMLNGLSRITITSNQADIASALVSLNEDINQANAVIVSQDQLTLIYPDNHYFLELHNGRLVKTPGFDIYLHQIDQIAFSTDQEYVYLHIRRGDQAETYNVGVFYRPNQTSFCESDGSRLATDADDAFNATGNNHISEE